MSGRKLGRQFQWLWAAAAVSAYGSWLGFGAFPLIAIRVLHAGPSQVSALSAVGTAAGAVAAVPLGPWVEFRRKRPVMIAMDAIRFAALATIPAAYGLGWLSFAQMMVVSVITATATLAFKSASGAYLKQVVEREDLLVANGRMASVNWSSSVLGPPLGGAAIGIFGPTVTVAADAASYLLSALGITAIGGHEPAPDRGVIAVGATPPGRDAYGIGPRLAGIPAGWRHILRNPALRYLFANSVLTGGLILATEPLIAVLMLGRFGFAPWQYSLAFAVPCIGGVVGSRMANRLAARFGRRAVMRVSGTLGACFPLGMALMRPGVAGLVIVMVVQLGVITSMGTFSPLIATYRLELAPDTVVARVLSAWGVSKNLALAALTMLWGVLAELTSPLAGIVVAGVLLLGTPFLLFPGLSPDRLPEPERFGRQQTSR